MGWKAPLRVAAKPLRPFLPRSLCHGRGTLPQPRSDIVTFAHSRWTKLVTGPSLMEREAGTRGYAHVMFVHHKQPLPCGRNVQFCSWAFGVQRELQLRTAALATARRGVTGWFLSLKDHTGSSAE